MKCPNCGSDSNGAFCPECGTPLKGAKCRSCSAALPVGANYCTKCGAPVAGRVRSPSQLPWLAAGAALLFLAFVLLWPRIRGSERDESSGRVPISEMQEAGGSSPGAPPPLTGTPREQADRLFNRVMTERESGDTAKATRFLPMAIQAYQIAGELDADGRYHLSLLQALNHDYSGALTTAEAVLATEPNHLLALSAAANAARAKGDTVTARKHYQRLLAAYDKESNSGKPEYEDHAKILPELRAEAQRFAH